MDALSLEVLVKPVLAPLHPGDRIDYRFKRLTPRGLINAGIGTAEVMGTTEESALIKSETRP
jgi:hypothetical protein